MTFDTVYFKFFLMWVNVDHRHGLLSSLNREYESRQCSSWLGLCILIHLTDRMEKLTASAVCGPQIECSKFHQELKRMLQKYSRNEDGSWRLPYEWPLHREEHSRNLKDETKRLKM